MFANGAVFSRSERDSTRQVKVPTDFLGMRMTLAGLFFPAKQAKYSKSDFRP
jgi:hypothetical protein